MKITGITPINHAYTKSTARLSNTKNPAAVSFCGDREVAYLLTQALRHAQLAKNYIGAKDPEIYTNDRKMHSSEEASNTVRTDVFLNAALHDEGFASFAQDPKNVLDTSVKVPSMKPYYGAFKTTLRETITKPNHKEDFNWGQDASVGGFYLFKERFMGALDADELGLSDDTKKTYAGVLDVLDSLNPFKLEKKS